MKHTTKGIAAIAATLALTLSACQGQGTTTPGETPSQNTNTSLAVQAQYNPQPRDKVKDGGTLTTAIGEITPQSNVFQANMTADTSTLWSWYNPIMALYAPDGTWSFNDDYLTDVKDEVVDGKTVVTYTIRDEAKFNDGTPIDWTAFEATWKANSGKDKTYEVNSSDGYDRVESVTKGATDKVAVVTFNGPWAWWQGQFNNILYPKVAATAKDFNESYLNQPHPEWGAGPYKIKTWDAQAGTVIFERNDKWWGDPGKLDQRIFKLMETQASLNAFKNGEIDATGASSKERYDQVKTMTGIDIRSSATASSALLTLNSKSAALADPVVRHAIMLGTDRKTIANVVFNGLNYTEEVPGSLTLFPFQKGYKDNATAAELNFDKAKAIELLEGAGYAKGADGFYAKDGKAIEVSFPTFGDSALTKQRATTFQSMMKDIGVNVKIDARPTSDFSKVIADSQFDILLSSFSSSDPFGLAYFCQIYCSDSSLNHSGTGTAELDAKIKEVGGLADINEQMTKANEVETEALKTYGLLPLYNGPTIIAVKQGLANYGASLFYVGKPQDIGWQS